MGLPQLRYHARQQLLFHTTESEVSIEDGQADALPSNPQPPPLQHTDPQHPDSPPPAPSPIGSVLASVQETAQVNSVMPYFACHCKQLSASYSHIDKSVPLQHPLQSGQHVCAGPYQITFIFTVYNVSGQLPYHLNSTIRA